MVDPGDPVSGIRLCLGGPSLEDVREGLALLGRIMKDTERSTT